MKTSTVMQTDDFNLPVAEISEDKKVTTPIGKRRVISFRATKMPGTRDGVVAEKLIHTLESTATAQLTQNHSTRQRLQALLNIAQLAVEKRRRRSACLKKLKLKVPKRRYSWLYALKEKLEIREIGNCPLESESDIPPIISNKTLDNDANKNSVKTAQISEMFLVIGAEIARRPRFYIILGVLLSFLSLGSLRIQLKDRIRDGYTPENALSRYETLVMREYLNASADPIMTILLVQARDGGSMLRLNHITETARLSRYLMNDFHLTTTPAMQNGPDLLTSQVTYAELCYPFCNTNLPLETFADTLADEIGQLPNNSSDSETVSLTYPVARIHGYKMYLERMFFGVELRNESVDNQELTSEQLVTNMDFVKVMMLLFRGDRSLSTREAALSAWELAVYDYLHDVYDSDILRVEAIGTEILDREMLEDGQKIMPFFVGGFMATVIFVFVTVVGRSLCTRTFDTGKILCATATVVSPTLAITLTYGIVSLLGLRVNSFLLILPYLVFGIGVDDGFLIMHAWFKAAAAAQRLGNTPQTEETSARTDAQRLASVLAEVGPSITVTTLTNIISFGIGAFSPTPEIRLFCFGTTLALLLVYILQFLFLCPVLELTKQYETRVLTICGEKDTQPASDQRYVDYIDSSVVSLTVDERKVDAANKIGGVTSLTIAVSSPDSISKEKSCWNSKLKNAFEKYCTIISSRLFGIILMAIMFIYWYFAIRGTLHIKTRLDASKVLPRDSRIQRTNLVLDQCVWNDYHAVTVLINKEFDLTNQHQVRDFEEMAKEFEALPKCRGAESSMNWLREYREFLAMPQDTGDGSDILSFISDLMPSFTDNSSSIINNSSSSDRRKQRFIDSAEHSLVAKSQVDDSTINLSAHHSEEDSNVSTMPNDTVIDSSEKIDTCRLLEFLDSPFRRHWNGFIHYVDAEPSADNDTLKRCPRITRFMLTIAYHDTATWENRIALMLQWRNITNAYHDSLNATVWEQNAMFIDQMLSLKFTTIQSGFLTLCCMIVICALFISNPFSVIIASVVIASICIGMSFYCRVFGFLSFMNFDLDPITMAALLMSIGLSVDYTAHVAYHFQQNSCVELCAGGVSRRVPLTNRQEKLRYTLHAVGWPLVQAAVSTALCVLPLIFVKKYAASVFFSTICVVTVLGLMHGLIVLPCVLSHLPAFCSSANFYAVFCTSMARKSYAIGAKHTVETKQNVGGNVAKKLPDEFLI